MSLAVTNSLTDFRVNLQDYLQAQLGIEFVGGMIDGPVEDRKIGCAWTASVEEWPDDVLLEQINVSVRIFLPWRQPQGTTNPTPAVRDLEQLAEDLQVILKPVQAAASGGTLGPWQFRLTGVEIDLETNGIEGSIQALQSNPFGLGG